MKRCIFCVFRRGQSKPLRRVKNKKMVHWFVKFLSNIFYDFETLLKLFCLNLNMRNPFWFFIGRENSFLGCLKWKNILAGRDKDVFIEEASLNYVKYSLDDSWKFRKEYKREFRELQIEFFYKFNFAFMSDDYFKNFWYLNLNAYWRDFINKRNNFFLFISLPFFINSNF